MLKRQNTNDLNKTSAHVCGFDVVFVQYFTLSSLSVTVAPFVKGKRVYGLSLVNSKHPNQ